MIPEQQTKNKNKNKERYVESLKEENVWVKSTSRQLSDLSFLTLEYKSESTTVHTVCKTLEHKMARLKTIKILNK